MTAARRAVTMDGDLGMTDLRAEWLEDTATSVRVVALHRIGFCFGSGGDHCEARDGTPMAIRTRLREFAGGNTLLPCARLQMMIIAHRVRDLRLEIFQLLFSVIGKEPVESLLIIWPDEVH